MSDDLEVQSGTLVVSSITPEMSNGSSGQVSEHGPEAARSVGEVPKPEPMPGDLDHPFCPECGLPFSKYYLSAHRRKVHGVRQRYSSKSPDKLVTHPEHPRRRGPGRPPTKQQAATVEKAPRPAAPPSADEITATAAEMLWAKGVPPGKMMALLRWHRATEEFLKEVQ